MKLRTWVTWRNFWRVDVSVGDDGTWAEVVGGKGGDPDRPRVLVSGAIDLRPAVLYKRSNGKWGMLTLRRDEE
jgi:hypothetical protein